MLADYNTMPEMFWYCNREYFDHKLITPKFGIIHSFRILARFEYFKGEEKTRKRKKILFSDYYDFDETTFRDLMVHEMIHYYLLLYGKGDKKVHGEEFQEMARQLNEKYGLHITETVNTDNIPNAPGAPKRTWWRCFRL